MKRFIAKRLNSILVNLRFKLLKYKENNKKICNTFDHNFKNIPLYIMRKVSLERYYFVLYDCALTSKMSKMVLKSFCDKTLHNYVNNSFFLCFFISFHLFNHWLKKITITATVNKVKFVNSDHSMETEKVTVNDRWLLFTHTLVAIFILKYNMSNKRLKSFIAKRVISILVNLRYLRFKLLKYKKNNKKICNTFDHNFKNIPLYIMSNVSLERYYFVLYDGALTLKMSKMALNAFCDKTLHLYVLM